MVSNESKYVEKQSLEMQMFMAENPELQSASTLSPMKVRDARKDIVF